MGKNVTSSRRAEAYFVAGFCLKLVCLVLFVYNITEDFNKATLATMYLEKSNGSKSVYQSSCGLSSILFLLLVFHKPLFMALQFVGRGS